MPTVDALDPFDGGGPADVRLTVLKKLMRLLGRATVAVALVLVGVVLLLFALSTRATRLVNSLVRDFATEQATVLSDSVYQLHVGQLHFNWPLRSVALDSVRLVTDSARNAGRALPLATVAVTLRACRITGIEVTRLLLARGLSVGEFGCDHVAFSSDTPPDTAPPAPKPVARPQTGLRDTTRAQAGRRAAGAFLTVQQGLVLPRQVPALHVEHIVFPTVAIALRRRETGGNDFTFDLERAQLRVSGVAIDPADSAAASRPLFSQSVVLTAQGTAVQPDTVSRIAVGTLEVNLTDSTVVVRDVSYGPQISDEQYRRLSPWRHERIRFAAGRVQFTGLDVGAFAGTGALLARTLELDSFRFDIRTDKRLPKRPGPSRPKRSLQAYIGTRPREFRIDSIRIRRAAILYEEWAERRDAPGRLAITDVEVDATSFRHVPGRVSEAEPFIVDIRALFVERGRLRAHFEVPLDAPRFTMRVNGSLGPMPATALNPFLSQIMPVQVKGGQILGATFDFRVTDGVARGRMTPLYTDLDVDITGTGATGIVGRRGLIGGIVRGAAEMAAGLKVRFDNPGEPGERPRTGTINRTFQGESIVSFFVKTLISGLLPVVVK